MNEGSLVHMELEELPSRVLTIMPKNGMQRREMMMARMMQVIEDVQSQLVCLR